MNFKYTYNDADTINCPFCIRVLKHSSYDLSISRCHKCEFSVYKRYIDAKDKKWVVGSLFVSKAKSNFQFFFNEDKNIVEIHKYGLPHPVLETKAMDFQEINRLIDKLLLLQ